MCEAGGIGIRVQGMTRYALLIKIELISSEAMKEKTPLATCKGGWKFGKGIELML